MPGPSCFETFHTVSPIVATAICNPANDPNDNMPEAKTMRIKVNCRFTGGVGLQTCFGEPVTKTASYANRGCGDYLSISSSDSPAMSIMRPGIGSASVAA